MELLAPAGNLQKLKSAVLYGADAVYLAGPHFGLRGASDNFSDHGPKNYRMRLSTQNVDRQDKQHRLRKGPQILIFEDCLLEQGVP